VQDTEPTASLHFTNIPQALGLVLIGRAATTFQKLGGTKKMYALIASKVGGDQWLGCIYVPKVGGDASHGPIRLLRPWLYVSEIVQVLWLQLIMYAAFVY